jgi:hypothetical protein
LIAITHKNRIMINKITKINTASNDPQPDNLLTPPS